MIEIWRVQELNTEPLGSELSLLTSGPPPSQLLHKSSERKKLSYHSAGCRWVSSAGILPAAWRSPPGWDSTSTVESEQIKSEPRPLRQSASTGPRSSKRRQGTTWTNSSWLGSSRRRRRRRSHAGLEIIPAVRSFRQKNFSPKKIKPKQNCSELEFFVFGQPCSGTTLRFSSADEDLFVWTKSRRGERNH